MTLDEQRWQQVNAYVDGELDPAAAADVAAAVARDRELAAAVAVVTRLKAATAASVEMPALSLASAQRPRWWVAAAASVVLLLGLGGAVAFQSWREAPQGALAKAIGQHVAWMAEDQPAAGTRSLGPTLAGLRQLGFAAEVPDLSDAGLHLQQVSLIEGDQRPAGLQVRYIGTRGCRISLIVEPNASGTVPERRQVGSVQVASWSVRDLRYTLLASGMYEQRFQTITATAEAATRRDVPAVDTLRQALRDQREQSPPCLG